MSILECRLAAEKEKDGKPFTVCEVSTWFYLGLGLAIDKKDRKGNTIYREGSFVKDKKKVRKEAKFLYKQFGNSKDKSERGITLEELKKLPSNGGIDIITKEMNNFIDVKKWGDYIKDKNKEE